MRKRMAFVFALSVLIAFPAFSQAVSSTMSNTGGRITGSATFQAAPFPMQAVPGAPYSATQTQEHVQTLNDGTHITQSMGSTKMYRDSFGRTRTERPMMMGPAMSGPNAPESPVIVEIMDPVAGFRYTLDAQNKVAHRVAMPPAGAPMTRPTAGVTGAGGVAGGG